MTRVRRAAVRAAVVGLTGSLLAGCGLTLQGVPLPGGADLGDDPYGVTVQMRDVLDLVPQAGVKVNNIAVGNVKAIDLDQAGWFANVRVEVNQSVKLPANAVATLKQTTLLGEKYIELAPPSDAPPEGMLADGAVIPVQRTNRFPEFEELFGALSMLLNGGGIGQVQNIARELNKALEGREGDTKALLHDLDTLVGTLDGQRTNITRALDGVDKLSARLSDQRENLDAVLVDLEPGLAVLNEQRPQLVGLLKALDELSDVAVTVVDRSHDDLVHDLKALQPTLRELARTGDTLPRSLEVLATPPFTDAAIKPAAGNALNLDFQLDLNITTLLTVLTQMAAENAASAPALPALPAPLNTLPTAPLPDVAGLLPGTSNSPSSPGGLKLPGLGGN